MFSSDTHSLKSAAVRGLKTKINNNNKTRFPSDSLSLSLSLSLSNTRLPSNSPGLSLCHDYIYLVAHLCGEKFSRATHYYQYFEPKESSQLGQSIFG